MITPLKPQIGDIFGRLEGVPIPLADLAHLEMERREEKSLALAIIFGILSQLTTQKFLKHNYHIFPMTRLYSNSFLIIIASMEEGGGGGILSLPR